MGDSNPRQVRTCFRAPSIDPQCKLRCPGCEPRSRLRLIGQPRHTSCPGFTPIQSLAVFRPPIHALDLRGAPRLVPSPRPVRPGAWSPPSHALLHRTPLVSTRWSSHTSVFDCERVSASLFGGLVELGARTPVCCCSDCNHISSTGLS